MKAIFDTCLYIDFLNKSRNRDLFDKGVFRFRKLIVHKAIFRVDSHTMF